MVCDGLRVHAGGTERLFPEAALEGFRDALGLTGAVPGVTTDMPPGGGAGASTASLVAVARTLGFDGPPERLASACLWVEGACDPLMFPRPDALLWASRRAEVVEVLPPPPPVVVAGGFWGAPCRTDPADTRFADVSDLVADWRAAVRAGDMAGVAQVATLSARRCAARDTSPDPMGALMAETGALGVVRAHTGSARGLIFAPGTIPDGTEDALREAGLTRVLRFCTGGGA
nr:hypothetical protein [Sagittula salina]